MTLKCGIIKFNSVRKERSQYLNYIMRNFTDWLLRSSANPDKTSLTIKSFVPFILTILPLLGVVSISENDLYLLINGIVAILSGISLIYGFGRKVYYLFK